MMRCWAAAGLLVVTAASALHAQTPEGTAFTYQGRLTDGGSPASGAYDLRFTLFDAATAGSPVGSAITNEDVAVNTFVDDLERTGFLQALWGSELPAR